MRSPNALRQRIRCPAGVCLQTMRGFASIRRRIWYPAQRFRKARPSWPVARRASLRASASGQSSFRGPPVLADQECGQDCHRSEGMPERGGLSDDDRRMAAAGVARAIGRHPADPLTLAIPPGNYSSTGRSPSLPGVNSTARMSGLAVSMARRAFRVCRPRCKTFPSQWAGPRTAIFCQAFFSGLSLPLGGMVIRGAGPQSCARALRLRCICRFSTSRSLRSLPVLVVDVLGSTILAYCDAVWGGRHPPSCATALHLRPMPAGLALPHHRGP